MNADKRVAVKVMLDFIYDSCSFEPSGKPRDTQERAAKFAWYIGWLEGNLLEFCTDEQADLLMERIKIRKSEDATYEAILHDDQDGSFY